MKRKVRLHPLPEGAPAPLVDFIGAAVAGAVRSGFDAHAESIPNRERGSLVGSIRKRAVNQILCAEGLEKLKDGLRGFNE